MAISPTLILRILASLTLFNILVNRNELYSLVYQSHALNTVTTTLSNNIRFRPTCDYTDYHGENQMDYVVRFEEFMHGLQYVFSRLELADDISRLTKKTQQADRSSDYRCYYKNNKMINIVGDFFHSDIKRYNDKF